MAFSCSYSCQIFWLIIISREIEKDFSTSENLKVQVEYCGLMLT